MWAARAASPRGSCPPGRPGARPAHGRRAVLAPDPNPAPAGAAAAPVRRTHRCAGTATARPPAAAAPPSRAGRRPGPAGSPGAGARPGHGTASGPQTARRACRGLRAGRNALACVPPPCRSRIAAPRPGPKNQPCAAWKSPALRLPHGPFWVRRIRASVHIRGQPQAARLCPAAGAAMRLSVHGSSGDDAWRAHGGLPVTLHSQDSDGRPQRAPGPPARTTPGWCAPGTGMGYPYMYGGGAAGCRPPPLGSTTKPGPPYGTM